MLSLKFDNMIAAFGPRQLKTCSIIVWPFHSNLKFKAVKRDHVSTQLIFPMHIWPWFFFCSGETSQAGVLSLLNRADNKCNLPAKSSFNVVNIKTRGPVRHSRGQLRYERQEIAKQNTSCKQSIESMISHSYSWGRQRQYRRPNTKHTSWKPRWYITYCRKQAWKNVFWLALTCLYLNCPR